MQGLILIDTGRPRPCLKEEHAIEEAAVGGLVVDRQGVGADGLGRDDPGHLVGLGAGRRGVLVEVQASESSTSTGFLRSARTVELLMNFFACLFPLFPMEYRPTPVEMAAERRLSSSRQLWGCGRLRFRDLDPAAASSSCAYR